MVARADSSGILGLSTASPAAFPAWARAEKPPESDAEAAFLVGAALACLDAHVRENPPWAGVFRQRLALGAAAASVRHAGRAEDEAALRDALHLTRPGADPGPAGRQLVAWRALTAGSTGQWRSAVGVAAEALSAPQDAALHDAVEAAKTCAAEKQPAPFAAAKTFQLVHGALTPGAGQTIGGRGGKGELLAAWLADAVLAQKLRWPFMLPLLAATSHSAGGRSAPGDASEGAETTRIVSAYARAAAKACDLFAELGRRAQKLQEAAPKLRAKGAGATLRALLDEDALGATTKFGGQISERGARRLFERLVALGAVRELTGRATFRLYGL
jgi:Protein of unknown function (DUF1403)